MTWNYRIIRDKNGFCHIGEVFYNDNKKDIWGYSDAIEVSGENKDEIIGTLKYMLADAKKYDVLDEEWLKENTKKPDWEDDNGEENVTKLVIKKSSRKSL